MAVPKPRSILKQSATLARCQRQHNYCASLTTCYRFHSLVSSFSECDVINMSLGILIDKRNGPEEATPQEYKKAIDNIRLSVKSAVNYASQKGSTIIVASGNDGLNFQGNKGDVLRGFADFQSVLPINACGPKGWVFDPANADFYQLTIYSNSGQESEFCAPGGQVDRTRRRVALRVRRVSHRGSLLVL
jgi:hypothetical protein